MEDRPVAECAPGHDEIFPPDKTAFPVPFGIIHDNMMKAVLGDMVRIPVHDPDDQSFIHKTFDKIPVVAYQNDIIRSVIFDDITI